MQVPKLTALCFETLRRNTGCLGNVGFLPTHFLQPLLQYVSNAEDLAAVEDATLAASARDLSWYTWSIWAKLYQAAYGPPANRGLDLEPLPGEPPQDYSPPVTSAKRGNWRVLYEAKAADIAARMAAVRGRLRGSYAVEEQLKARTSARATDKLPPPKRARTPGGSDAAASRMCTLSRSAGCATRLGPGRGTCAAATAPAAAATGREPAMAAHGAGPIAAAATSGSCPATGEAAAAAAAAAGGAGAGASEAAAGGAAPVPGAGGAAAKDCGARV